MLNCYTSFRDLRDGDGGYALARHQDHDLLFLTEQLGEQLLTQRDLAALHDAAGLGFLGNTDSQIVLHRVYRPF